MQDARELEIRRAAQLQQRSDFTSEVLKKAHDVLAAPDQKHSREGTLATVFEKVQWHFHMQTALSSKDMLEAMADALIANEHSLEKQGAYRTASPPPDSEQGKEIAARLQTREELLIIADFLAIIAAEDAASAALFQRHSTQRKAYQFVARHAPLVSAAAILGFAAWGLGFHFNDVTGAIHYVLNGSWYDLIAHDHPDWGAHQIWQYMATHHVPQGALSAHAGALITGHLVTFVGGGAAALYGMFLASTSKQLIEQRLNDILKRLEDKHKIANADELHQALQQAVAANRAIFESRLIDALGEERCVEVLEPAKSEATAVSPVAEQPAESARLRVPRQRIPK